MPRPSAKAKLTEAALASFIANGFKSCTIEDIASKAGVFKGSFYNHFKSKEALAVEVVRLYMAEAMKTILLEGPPSPLKRLRKHFEVCAAYHNQARCMHGCLIANFSAEMSDSTSDLRSALNDAVEQWCRALAEVIRQAQAAGEISKDIKADFFARFLVNAWEGAAIRTKVVGSMQPLDDFFASVFTGFLSPKK